jgi:predicted O-methyltransferase YrrM
MLPQCQVMTGSLPDQVLRAQRLAEAVGFPLTREQAGPGQASACLPGVGRFLATLAAGCGGGLIAELGTGVGIGTAWLSGAMPADCRLVTAEIDERLAATARELFTADRRVDVVTGDALAVVRDRGPFDLIFADCGVRDDAQFDALVDRLAIGGRIVMDDLTPAAATSAAAAVSDDAKRRFFASARLVSTEVVLPDLRNSLLVGTRVA